MQISEFQLHKMYLIEMKISVFLNADVSNTNADFYVMIENRDICISQVQISAFQ